MTGHESTIGHTKHCGPLSGFHLLGIYSLLISLEVQVSPSTADPIQRFHVMDKKVFDDDIIRSPLFTSVSCPLSRRKRLVCAYADAPIGAHTNNYITTSSAYSADVGDSTSTVMCWASARFP